MISCLLMGIRDYMGGDMGYVDAYESLKCYPNDTYWYEMLCMLNRWYDMKWYMIRDNRWFATIYDMRW